MKVIYLLIVIIMGRYYMFPEKIIIDAISDYEISNPQTTKSDVSFDDVKYEMTIFDYMTRNVLLHVPTNTILHFGFHPSYYSYYQNDYFNKSHNIRFILFIFSLFSILFSTIISRNGSI